jgi:uncharacterized repeat protein (TIGR01451 family)
LNDTIVANNVVNLHQLVTLAWDPNEKLAEPSGDILAGTEIQYSIHFQNTGNAPADNVIIKDTIDSGLDLLSFRLLGTSHTMNMTIDGAGIITFTFYNIQLPDSGSDMAGSNGYIDYAITSRTSLTPGMVINNTAGIIFDSNIPIITNTTVNTIRLETGIAQHASSYYISASPNPASTNIAFDFSKDQFEYASLTIRTVDGRTVLVNNKITSTENINI